MRFSGLPDPIGLAGDVGGAIYRAVTPRTAEPEGGPAPQSARGYLGEQARALNPLTPSGALNWATMFAPGGKGGWKAVGPLTPGQKILLQRLGNVTGGGKMTPGQRSWMEQLGETAGVDPEKWAAHLDRYRHDRYIVESPDAMKTPKPGDVADMAKVFGVPRGEPLDALRGHVDPPGSDWMHLKEATDRKLGIGEGGEKPDWMHPGYGDMHYLQKYIGSRADPDVDAMLSGMSDAQRAIVSMIMRTIDRRPPPGDKGAETLGSWMGSGSERGPLTNRGAALRKELHDLLERMPEHAAPQHKANTVKFVAQLRNAIDQGHYEFARKMLSSNSIQWGDVAGKVHFPAMDKLDQLKLRGHGPPEPPPPDYGRN